MLEKVKLAGCDGLVFQQYEVMGERRFRATEDRNQEERTAQAEDYTETIKNHHSSLQRVFLQREEGNREIEPARNRPLKLPAITGKLNNIYKSFSLISSGFPACSTTSVLSLLYIRRNTGVVKEQN